MKPKTASLTLRVSPDTRQALDAAAEQRGVKVGTLAAQVMDAWAKRQGDNDEIAGLLDEVGARLDTALDAGLTMPERRIVAVCDGLLDVLKAMRADRGA